MHRPVGDGTERLTASAPRGWTVLDDDGRNDVVLVGPQQPHGHAPKVEVRKERIPPEPVEFVSLRVLHSLGEERPGVLVAACDLWPHPRWGVGRLYQTAFADGGQTYAADRYVFVDGAQLVSVNVQCQLDDLLRYEEAVAGIVASVQAGG